MPADPIWKPIPGWDGLYEVSDAGTVRSLDRSVTAKPGYAPYIIPGRIIRPYENNGHWMVNLYRAGAGKAGMFRVFVHHLVLLTFAGPRPEGAITRHLDGDGFNNRVDNIAWGTHRENTQDQRRLGEMRMGETHGMAVLNEEAVRHIRREMAKGKRGTARALGRLYNVVPSTVVAVADRRTWAHLPPLPDEAGSRWRPNVNPWASRRSEAA